MDLDEQHAIWSALRTGYTALVEDRRRRDRRIKIAGLGLTVMLALAEAATAALLAMPAPLDVRHDLAGVDQGLPADLRLNPDVTSARLVASSGSSALYAANLKGGGYCSEIVTRDGRRHGAICETADDVRTRPIEVGLPSDDSASSSAAITIGGRVNIAADRLEIVYSDGGKDEIPLSDDRFFVFEVPARHLATAHLSEMVLTTRDADGSVRGQVSIPADWDRAAVSDDTRQLFVSTRSDSSDLTKVYAIEGHVAAPTAVSLELRYVDGTRVAIPIDDRDYLYSVPSSRVAGFMRPQLLVALDETGKVVAQAPVAAVAYWAGQERHR